MLAATTCLNTKVLRPKQRRRKLLPPKEYALKILRGTKMQLRQHRKFYLDTISLEKQVMAITMPHLTSNTPVNLGDV